MKILHIFINFGSLIINISNTTYKHFLRAVQSMYRNPRNRVGRVVNFFSDNFLFQAVLHQGSLHRAVIVIKSNESRMRGYVALHLSFASAF